VQEVVLPAARFDAALDQVTRWLLEQLETGPLPDGAAKIVLAPPSESRSAIEYYTRALEASRKDDLRDALRDADRALGYDKRFRPALSLMARLGLRTGNAGRRSTLLTLRALREVARSADDEHDRADVELALSILDQARGASAAAETRALTALNVGIEQRDVYLQVATLAWLTDLYISWQYPPEELADEVQREARDAGEPPAGRTCTGGAGRAAGGSG
jgi:multidrug efflux pump subunit AcrA (membrane-fusion protein)